MPTMTGRSNTWLLGAILTSGFCCEIDGILCLVTLELTWRKPSTSMLIAHQGLAQRSLFAIFHVGLWTIASGRGLGVPAAALVLVFDGFGLSRDALLAGRGACRRECCGVSWKRFRECAADLVGPPILVANDLISDVGHRIRLCQGLPHKHIMQLVGWAKAPR